MLGIAWGIVSVVMLLAYGDGFHEAIAAGFRGAFGSGVAVIWPGQTSLQAGGERAGRRVRLRVEDVEALEALPLVRLASPEFVKRLPIAFGERQAVHAIRGVNRSYGEMRNERAAPGRGGSSTISTSKSGGVWPSSVGRSRESCSAHGRPSARRFESAAGPSR